MIANGHFLRVVAERTPGLVGADLHLVAQCAERLDGFDRLQVALQNFLAGVATGRLEPPEDDRFLKDLIECYVREGRQ